MAGIVFLFGTFSGFAEELGANVGEPGVFSYQAPKGWQITTSPVSRFKLAVDVTKNNFAANLNVVRDEFPGPLEDYVAANKKALKASTFFQNLQFSTEKAFTTAAGMKGMRLVARDTLNKADLQQIFYFFAGPKNSKLVVTATSLATDADHYAPIFDASVKTFVLK